jgi:hypothetical protein
MVINDMAFLSKLGSCSWRRGGIADDHLRGQFDAAGIQNLAPGLPEQ